MSSHQQTNAGNGPPSAGVQHQQGPSSSQNMSQQNLNQIVIEYLNKKGYSKTEQTLRDESANVDSTGKPIHDRVEDLGPAKYGIAMKLLTNWIDGNLDLYKTELKRLEWPIFAYSFFDLISNGSSTEGETFLKEFGPKFEHAHLDEIRVFETMTLPQHVTQNSISSLYRGTKYRLPLNMTAYSSLMNFLEEKGKEGGTVIINLLQTYLDVRVTERGPLNQYSFEAIVRNSQDNVNDPDLQEGIPGAFVGVSNQDINNNSAPLKLGPMPMEVELAGDVRADLEDEDARNPPHPGQPSLVEEFDKMIKREELMDGPSRNEIPLPPSRQRDVVLEVQKIKEHRDRFRIEDRGDGAAPAVSICMFTFHNTQDRISCMEFSDDTNIVACGTEDSYIRVWHLHGQPLPALKVQKPGDPPLPNSRRLIGHSAPVYAVSFSPSILGPDNTPNGEPVEKTHPKLLLSCSSDKTIRLWSLEIWQCLIVYKGHDGPVWDVRFGPWGHYFVSAGWDKTARVWVQDKAAYQRIMVGHDTNCNKIAWHPNGAYVFSASDNADKTVRMWSVVTGDCVRVFSGHTDFISALECSPNGKILASADGAGSIILWDLAKGVMIKRCKGHGKGGIWSLSFCVESTVLASGGADGTVRIWDVNGPQESKHKEGEIIATGGQADATRITNTAIGAQVGASGAGGSGATAGGGKKKGKETTITPDQLGAFPTKKTPVYKVKFTRMNLIMAGGCFMP